MPAVKLFKRVDTLPAKKLAKTVRTMMTIKPSSGPNITSARREKMLESPIFAPGKNNGGNRFSTKNIIRLSAEKRDSTAIL